MSVRLTEEETWAELERAHTGIFTTLRADGFPVSLPVWFVVFERNIYLQTPEKAKKVARVRRDGRGSFLVERGERWAELAAVEMSVRISLVEEEGLRAEILGMISEKYRAFRTSSRQMPDATRAHYAAGTAVIRLVPEGRVLTWDNAKLRLNAPEGAA